MRFHSICFSVCLIDSNIVSNWCHISLTSFITKNVCLCYKWYKIGPQLLRLPIGSHRYPTDLSYFRWLWVTWKVELKQTILGWLSLVCLYHLNWSNKVQHSKLCGKGHVSKGQPCTQPMSAKDHNAPKFLGTAGTQHCLNHSNQIFHGDETTT